MLVVSEVCAGGYGAGRVGEVSTRGKEGLVGCSAAHAAVGVAEAEQVSSAWRAGSSLISPPFPHPSLPHDLQSDGYVSGFAVDFRHLAKMRLRLVLFFSDPMANDSTTTTG